MFRDFGYALTQRVSSYPRLKARREVTLHPKSRNISVVNLRPIVTLNSFQGLATPNHNAREMLNQVQHDEQCGMLKQVRSPAVLRVTIQEP